MITTAAVPGRPAPKLLTEEMVRAMRPGSVIVDLAAETGGNCELTEPGEVVVRNGVTIDGTLNLPSQMPFHASLLYAQQRREPAAAPVVRRAAEARLRGRDHGRAAASRTAARSSTSGCAGRRDREPPSMTLLINEITIFVLAVFVGFEVISKVPTMLHTPLMSGTNAIHGIVLLGGLLVVGRKEPTRSRRSPGPWRSSFGTINIVGGFLVTDRMLEMFKGAATAAGGRRRAEPASSLDDRNFIDVCYLVASVLLHPRHPGLSHPRTARQGNTIAAVGMAIAVVATLLDRSIAQLRPDHRRHRDRRRDRAFSRAHGEDDRDAADGGAVQRRRRRRRRADRACPSTTRAFPTPGHPGRHADPDRLRLRDRRGQLRRSLIAFAKLQELMTGRPIVFPGNSS